MPRDGRATAKAKLPKLQPNVNRRAQQIITAHMQLEERGEVGTVSTNSVPILSKLERTAPKTARSHDVSHLCDQPMHLTPSLPLSLIEEKDHVYESSFLPVDASSTYREEDGLWHTKVFPSDNPSSRTDAVMLDNWISKALEEVEDHLTETQRSRDDFADTVQELVPVLSVALHEIVRQVMHHCPERGAALQKIWRTYVELFERVLEQMRQSLKIHKERTGEIQQELKQANQEVKDLKREHPEQMHTIISELEAKFMQRQRNYEQDLQEAEEENLAAKTAIRTQHREMENWYPGFAHYQDSFVKNLLPQMENDGASAKMFKESATTEDAVPEVAMAEDFKRLLAALPPEKRKIIGKDLMGLIDGDEVQRMQDDVPQSLEDQQQEIEEIERLQGELQKQEEHIKKLKLEIAQIETANLPNDLDHAAEDEEQSPYVPGVMLVGDTTSHDRAESNGSGNTE
ncbi:eryA [Symbiodinium microadriaticum]|nr:eryA [Symbiodinium microadriaticum]CAE7948087.1 eryA [Symbiodinium sp. KB8]